VVQFHSSPQKIRKRRFSNMKEIDITLRLTDDALKLLLSHAVNDILQEYMEKQIDLEIEKGNIIEGEI
jgi:hypothetical protein